MKKQINKITCLILCCLLAHICDAQVVAADSKSGRTELDCGNIGRHTCFSSTVVLEGRNNDQTPPILLSIDANDRLVMQINKERLSKEVEDFNYKNKTAFYIEENITLDDTVREALQREKGDHVIIQAGWYPIIETPNSYLIAYNLAVIKK